MAKLHIIALISQTKFSISSALGLGEVFVPAKPRDAMVKTNPILQSYSVTMRSSRHASPHVQPTLQEHTHAYCAVWRSNKCLPVLHEGGTHVFKEVNINWKPMNTNGMRFCHSWNRSNRWKVLSHARPWNCCCFELPDCDDSSLSLQLKIAVQQRQTGYVCQVQSSATDLIQKQQDWERKLGVQPCMWVDLCASARVKECITNSETWCY